jgi:ABC-type transport system involved in cytochrome c biogenesis permease subunit
VFTLTVIACLLLVLGALLAPIGALLTRVLWRRASRFSALAGALLGLFVGIWQWAHLGRPPGASVSEMFIIIGPLMALAYLVGEGLSKSREAGLPVLLLAALLTFLGNGSLPPAVLAGDLPHGLKSFLIVPYLVFAMIGFSFLLTASIQALVLLVLRRMSPPRTERAGRVVYWSVCLGFPFLLCSLVTAVVWSGLASGQLLPWTRRGLWMLCYCLLLMAYLNLHLIAGWREKRAVWFLLLVSLVGLGSLRYLPEMPGPDGDQVIAVPVSRSSPKASPSPRPVKGGAVSKDGERHERG